MDTEARTDVRTQGAAAQPQMGPGRSDGKQEMSYRTMQIREVRPRGDETKLSIKTSEFWIYMAAVGAILIAASSNNVVKAIYAIAYSGVRVRLAPAALVFLAMCGIAAVVVL